MRALDEVYQLAFTVEALEPAVERWARRTGAGPFFIFNHFALLDGLYHGQPASPDVSIALGYSGSVMIELIEVHEGGGSMFAKGGPAQCHHVAQLARDFDAALERYEDRIVFTGRFEPDTRVAFADTRADLGCYTELIAYGPDVEGLMGLIEGAAKAWDGRDPIRRL